MTNFLNWAGAHRQSILAFLMAAVTVATESVAPGSMIANILLGISGYLVYLKGHEAVTIGMVVRHEVNSRLTELIQAHGAAERAVGHADGFAAGAASEAQRTTLAPGPTKEPQ